MEILRIDAWLHGAAAALQAGMPGAASASPDTAFPSVTAWALLIAAGVVLLEWLLARAHASDGVAG